MNWCKVPLEWSDTTLFYRYQQTPNMMRFEWEHLSMKVSMRALTNDCDSVYRMQNLDNYCEAYKNARDLDLYSRKGITIPCYNSGVYYILGEVDEVLQDYNNWKPLDFKDIIMKANVKRKSYKYNPYYVNVAS